MEVETVNSNQIVETLLKYGVGFRLKDDPIFDDGNKLEQPVKKLGVYSVIAEEDLHIKNPVRCNIPNCQKEFDTIFGYESHYNSCHRHLCNECHKNLPSAHLLDLHLSETHDSFFAVQSQTKPMFACYVEECRLMFPNADQRKDHCITSHKFPNNFRFDVKSSANKNSKTDSVSGDTVEAIPVDGVSDIQKPIRTINFGHSKVKTFKSDTCYAKALTKNQKKKPPTQILDDNKMVVDLMASLPE
ncbi:hypothetical protein HA402_004429 [Bradysia odoriphaga]|nr:hypothetical protein HA402_004429 [Bradysia odoriphaga]